MVLVIGSAEYIPIKIYLQVQTFNTSLPHAFIGSAQATTIVDHRVEISDKLDLQIELSGWKVTRGFPQFNKEKTSIF